MLNEIIDVSSKLIEFIKGKTNHLQETQPGLDSQFVVESDLKIKGFKRGFESLARSLQTITGLLHEKSSSIASDSHLASIDPTMSTELNNQSSEFAPAQEFPDIATSGGTVDGRRLVALPPFHHTHCHN